MIDRANASIRLYFLKNAKDKRELNRVFRRCHPEFEVGKSDTEDSDDESDFETHDDVNGIFKYLLTFQLHS